MKKILLLVCVMMFLCEFSFSQQNNINNLSIKGLKSRFDFQPESANQLKSSSFDVSRRMVQDEVWEYSMMREGYFTLGTNQGNSTKIIDDNCEITFGHPYSMTSFAYPVIDGNKYLPYELTTNDNAYILIKNDTLSVEQHYALQFLISTTLYIDGNGNVELEYQIINGDGMPHTIGMGLLFDAALGKWGDGFAFSGNEVLNTVTEIDGAALDSVIVWERKQVPKGIGVQVDFAYNKPAKIVAGNWYDEYTGDMTSDQIYDLALHAQWDETVIPSGDSVRFKIRFSMPEPDYNDQLFIRWDMPNALSIEDQQLFPANLSANVEIINNSQVHNDLVLKIPESDYVYGWESDNPFAFSSPNEPYFEIANVQFSEIYDSLVSPVTLQLLQSGLVADALTRNVFIPAAPFSNEGLEVTIDTLYTSYGRVNMGFQCANQETGQLISNLHKNNVFLYENNIPVEDFTLGKDTSGGVNNADIIFVLDVTGSMADEIDNVRDNIIEFADSLSFRGVDYQLGMVTFLDVIENVYDFTDNVQEFQYNVSLQYAHGGDDEPENSLDALSRAAQFDFRDNSNRIFIWITDASFHINNQYTQQTKENVIDQLLAKGITVYCIGNPVYQTDFYDQIVISTGGSFYDIYGNFRDILLEVSRMGQASKQLVSFVPSDGAVPDDIFKIEIHYAGLGGMDTIRYGSALKSAGEVVPTSIQVYPNPFGNDTHLRITGSALNSYKLEIYNVNGQLLDTRTLNKNAEIIDINLFGYLNHADIKTTQVFLLKTTTLSPTGELLYQETKKIKKF